MRNERAQTLIELVVVVGTLAAVLTPISSSFVSSMNYQTQQTRRENAQANARVRSIGSASTSTAPTPRPCPCSRTSTAGSR